MAVVYFEKKNRNSNSSAALKHLLGNSEFLHLLKTLRDQPLFRQAICSSTGLRMSAILSTYNTTITGFACQHNLRCNRDKHTCFCLHIIQSCIFQ